MTEPEAGQLARLAVLEAKFAILEHTVSYNEAWDDGRLDDWVATWTGNGLFVLPTLPIRLAPRHSGRWSPPCRTRGSCI
jgi:hypothetical protein